MAYRPVSRSSVRRLAAEARPGGDVAGDPEEESDAGWLREDRLSRLREEVALRAWEEQRARRAWEKRRVLEDGRIALDLGLVWH